VLGADSSLGRDELLRLLYGGRASLEVAFGATLLGLAIALLLGASAGFLGGILDTVVSRLQEITMALPVLLLVIALAATGGERLNQVAVGELIPPGVVTLVVVLGLFSWFYPARIIRAVALGLRSREFVEAARSLGSSETRIIRVHVLPHLAGPLAVYAAFIFAQTILLEAGLSYLGLGIQPPTPSWGNMLAVGAADYLSQPWLILWPGLAVFVTCLAVGAVGEQLRRRYSPEEPVR